MFTHTSHKYYFLLTSVPIFRNLFVYVLSNRVYLHVSCNLPLFNKRRVRK